MRNLIRLAAIAATSLALAACGGSNDASDDLDAETVEMPADAALEPVTEEPVADTSAAIPQAEGPPTVSQQTAEAAADRAAKVAAEAAAAAEAAEAAEAAANISVE